MTNLTTGQLQEYFMRKLDTAFPIPIRIRFSGFDCIIKYDRYQNERHVIQLIDPDDGQIVATASVNIPDESIEDDEVIIKDYSENRGMYDVLVEAGVVSKVVRYITTGHVVVPLCILLNPPEQEVRL